MGNRLGTASFIQILANELSDSMLSDLLDTDSNLIITMHIKAIDHTEAVKIVKRKLTDVNAMKIEAQKKAIQNGYDMDIISPDLMTYGEEAKNLLQDLQNRNEKMYLVTFVVVNFADTKRQLENDVFSIQNKAQVYSCPIIRLDYQQENGLMSSLPLGLNLIDIHRGLTTSSTAVFIPFIRPRTQMYTDEYDLLQRKVKSLSARAGRADGEKKQQLLGERKIAKAELLKIPSKSQTDKKIKYIRYADDFIIGLNGSKDDCVQIKKQLSEFIANTLKMELSDEKALITHSNNYARFLGYDVRVRRDNRTITNGGTSGFTKRTLNNMTELVVPLQDKIMTFLFDRGAVIQKNGVIKPMHRKSLLHCTDLEIVSSYNAELRGICNYYSMASNFYKLQYFAYLMEYSCLKTLANRHKTRVCKIMDMYKDGKGRWGIPYQNKSGEKRCYFAAFMDCKKAKTMSDIRTQDTAMHRNSITSFESRLSAKKCELCDTSEAEHYEIHHVHRVKDLEGKEQWERVMIAKNRKTMVLCKECHYRIHSRVLNN